jgi:hypothetical protein
MNGDFGIQFGVPVTGASALLEGSGVTYLISTLILGVIIAVVVLIIDTFYPILPMNPLTGPSASARAVKTFWTNLSAETENLVVPVSASPTTQPSVYSMSVQLMIGDSRAPNIGKYRHVLHRGSNPCQLSSSSAGPTGHAGIQPGDLPPSTEPTYTTQGLPQIMNPGLFLDNYKNDLHVFVHTRSDGRLLLESMTISDLPLNTPLTVGIICNGNQLEVYTNCRLYSTQMLVGTPYLPPNENQWFGRYCAFPMSGLVKNLQLWPVALVSSDLIQMCRSGSGAFNGDTMPSSCASNKSS